MKILDLLAAAAASQAQTVAIVNGKPVTQAELDFVKSTIPPELRQALGTQETLLRYYGFMSRMAEEAEKAGLADKSPYKEQLAMQRKMLLGQAMQTEYGRSTPVTAADEQKYYEEHRDLFRQAAVVSLRLKDAAEAEQVRKQIAAGADAAALAKEHPGEYTSIRACDTDVPSEIRKAVFGAKAGDVVVAGAYLIKVEKIAPMTLEESRGFASKAFADERYQAWMNRINQSVTVEKK